MVAVNTKRAGRSNHKAKAKAKANPGSCSLPRTPSPAEKRWWSLSFSSAAVCLAALALVASGCLALSRGSVLRPFWNLPEREAWHSMTHDERREALGCGAEAKTKAGAITSLAIHPPSTWAGMREAYASVVGEALSTLEPEVASLSLSATDTDTATDTATDTDTAPLDPTDTAFRVPYEVRLSEGRGRGVFAASFVPAGSLVYDFSRSAQFFKGEDFVEILRILRPDLACDVLMWSYVQAFPGGRDSIVTDLDPGSFCNGGGNASSNGSADAGAPNLGWVVPEGGGHEDNEDNGNEDEDDDADDDEYEYERPPAEPVRLAHAAALFGEGTGFGPRDAVKSAPFVALRDISEGEEFLCSYDALGDLSEVLG
ncbi:unnamed protein product [Pseudo-nitzschia multistriata]|uniref:SET domain-containing protein n=1 Tax=Pseudo-nitzschia multistriata TaxID=183589 RepID=A0A448Z101_9STRA|nr:unnamed protein product [Pseudo-nitzschia multistriata]